MEVPKITLTSNTKFGASQHTDRFHKLLDILTEFPESCYTHGYCLLQIKIFQRLTHGAESREGPYV